MELGTLSHGSISGRSSGVVVLRIGDGDVGLEESSHGA